MMMMAADDDDDDDDDRGNENKRNRTTCSTRHLQFSRVQYIPLENRYYTETLTVKLSIPLAKWMGSLCST